MFTEIRDHGSEWAAVNAVAELLGVAKAGFVYDLCEKVFAAETEQCHDPHPGSSVMRGCRRVGSPVGDAIPLPPMKGFEACASRGQDVTEVRPLLTG